MPRLPRSPSACAWSLATALLGLAIALPVTAQNWGQPLFAWTDGQGAVRYTAHPEQVPRAYRDTLREVLETANVLGVGAIRLNGSEPGPGGAGFGVGQAGGGQGGGTPGAAGNPGDADLAEGAASLSGPNVLSEPDPLGAASAPSVELTGLDREIAELKAAIARDQETLKTLISDPEAAPQLAGSADLDAISKRLPEQQAALTELLARRAREQGPTP